MGQASSSASPQMEHKEYLIHPISIPDEVRIIAILTPLRIIIWPRSNTRLDQWCCIHFTPLNMRATACKHPKHIERKHQAKFLRTIYIHFSKVLRSGRSSFSLPWSPHWLWRALVRVTMAADATFCASSWSKETTKARWHAKVTAVDCGVHLVEYDVHVVCRNDHKATLSK